MASPELQRAKRDATNTNQLSSNYNPKDSSKPDYESACFVAMKAGWCIMKDTNGGTMVMRNKAAQYLPQMPLEFVDDYQQRIKATEFFNAVARTVRGLVGMVFRRPPKLGADVNPMLTEQWENIDGSGTHGEVFTREAYEEAMLLGHGAILVDYPSVPDGYVPTLKDERDEGIRPYWVKLCAEQIISWRTATRFGKTYLSQVVIRENTLEPEGDFGEYDVERYRVFRHTTIFPNADYGETFDPYAGVQWQLWEWVEKEGAKTLNMTQQGTLKTAGGKPMTRIPVTAYFTGRVYDWFGSTPPLIDLAYANIAHWNVLSDHRHSLHKASIPLLCFIGRDTTEGAQAIGVNQGIDIPLGGDLKYVEHAGSALAATDKELTQIEGRMAALGLAMLQQDTRAAETAEAKRIDKADQDSALASSARSLQDAIEEAMSFHAEFLGQDTYTNGSVLVNRDFEDLTLDSGTIGALSNLHLAGQVDLDTLWSMLEQGNVLPEDFDRELTRAAIMNEEAQRAAQALALAAATPEPKDDTTDSADSAPPAEDTK